VGKACYELASLSCNGKENPKSVEGEETSAEKKKVKIFKVLLEPKF